MIAENSPELKAIALISYAPFVYMCYYLSLDEMAMSVLAILMIADLFTGIVKTVVIGEEISFKRFYNGILSKVALMMVPLLFALVVKALGVKFELMLYSFIAVLILSEFYSNLANIYTVRTGKAVAEFDPVARFLKLIQSKLNKMMPDE